MLNALLHLEIRLATLEEAEDCREIIHKAYEAGRKLMSRDPKVLLKPGKDFVDLAKKKRLYVIIYENNLIGTFTLTLKDPPAILQYFALVPKCQNRGWGSNILLWIENYVRENEFDVIRLETYEKWVQTNRFYQQRGYQHIDSFTKENETIFIWEKVVASIEPIESEM
ncbi:MAG: GNAT family N-acetyltransferase [Candidatus Hodarchaeota archaeon]